MSQTNNYTISPSNIFYRNVIKEKLKSNLHTHMNANLDPDTLIAIAIKFQLKMPLNFIKKINIKLYNKQKEILNSTGVEYINFADLILNNIKNFNYNISKIRSSLVFKEGQWYLQI